MAEYEGLKVMLDELEHSLDSMGREHQASDPPHDHLRLALNRREALASQINADLLYVKQLIAVTEQLSQQMRNTNDQVFRGIVLIRISRWRCRWIC